MFYPCCHGICNDASTFKTQAVPASHDRVRPQSELRAPGSNDTACRLGARVLATLPSHRVNSQPVKKSASDPAQFQFTDTQAANFPQRLYQIRSPWSQGCGSPHLVNWSSVTTTQSLDLGLTETLTHQEMVSVPRGFSA